jgi:hypothetical protein
MNLNKLGAIGATLVVAVVAGALLTGSPAQEPERGADALRLQALQQLSAAIGVYYQESGALPAHLAALLDSSRLAAVPTDPVSSRPYEYAPETDDSYMLCAQFDAASVGDESAGFWKHNAGRSCFRLSPAYGGY